MAVALLLAMLPLLPFRQTFQNQCKPEHEKNRKKIPGASGYRVVGKVRSLNLGLGLLCAPTKVRERTKGENYVNVNDDIGNANLHR